MGGVGVGFFLILFRIWPKINFLQKEGAWSQNLSQVCSKSHFPQTGLWCTCVHRPNTYARSSQKPTLCRWRGCGGMLGLDTIPYLVQSILLLYRRVVLDLISIKDLPKSLISTDGWVVMEFFVLLLSQINPKTYFPQGSMLGLYTYPYIWPKNLLSQDGGVLDPNAYPRSAQNPTFLR